MNIAPVHGTKYLGGAIIVLGALTTTYYDQIVAVTGKWGPLIESTLLGVLTILRGFQNGANVAAQAAAPSPSANPPPPPAASPPKSLALWLLVPLAAMLLGGCAVSGKTPTAAQTFDQLVLSAGTVDDAVINTTDALVKAQSISSQTALTILSLTDKIQAALTAANTAYKVNDQTTATGKLSAASAALAGVQACLTKPATIAVCLQGVTSP